MQDVIRKLIPENNMDFEEICSFETKSYIGIWNANTENFVMFAKADCEFWLYELAECEDLEELDNEVFSLTNEHILCVSDCSRYTFKIDEE